MSRFRRSHTAEHSTSHGEEDPVVRQYRFLLRTAPADAVEAANDEALQALPGDRKQHVLDVLQGTFLVGGHLRETDTRALAHLIVATERRIPGALLTALDPEVLGDLARTALEADAAFGLLNGYSTWDGHDPTPEDDSLWADGGFSTKAGHTDAANMLRDDGFRFGGGGGGG